MKKKVFSLLLALLILLGSIPMTLMTAAAEGISSLADNGDDELPVVSIELVDKHSIKDENGKVIAKPDASGYVHLIIKATNSQGEMIKDLAEDITVYYATEDLSAVAAAGDYEAKSGSVVLPKANPQVEIFIKTSRAEYSITIDNSSYISRSFKVKLTGVSENAKLKEDPKENPDANSVKCSLLAEHNLKAYGFREATVLSPYTSFENYDLINVLTTNPCDGGESYSKTVPVNFPASWYADYVQTGVGAKLYMALRDAHIDESSWNSSSQVRVYIGEVGIQLKGEFHDNNEFGWGQFILSSHYNVPGSNNKFEKYTDENFMFAFWTGYDDSLMSINVNSPQYLNPIIRDKYIIRRYYYGYGEPTSKPNNPGEFYIGLSDYLLSHNSIRISLESWGGYSRRLSGGTVTFRLEDVTPPKIEKNNNSYAIYHNFDTVKMGEKLRVAIRFDEPVQVEGQVPHFVGKVNGIGTGIEPHPYAIRFTYVGGSGTDTLYFESEYKGDYQINSITDIQFRYADSIKDFGGVANSFSAVSGLVIDGFNLDKRIPVISVQGKDVPRDSDPWTKSKDISLTVSNISDEAVLYYSWVGKDAVPTFENSVALSNITVDGTQTVTIGSEGDGEKYLYVKVVTKYGQEQREITILRNNDHSKTNRLGPYKFDNTAPTIDETKLLPVAKESNLKVKKYSIPVPRDAASKNIDLNMYYVDENDETHLVKTYQFTEKDTKPFEFELKAADVGVHDDITRREITVYFTLTDEMGNIRENVGNHRTVFDTRDYIQVEYAGSTPEFASKTDFLNEGYVMVYNGDLQSNSSGFCYGFEFSGIDNPPDGRTYLFMERNGIAWEDGSVWVDDVIENGNLVGMTVNFYAPLEEGYYDIYLGCFRGDITEAEKQNGRRPDYVSEVYRVYVGSGKGKLDQLINEGTVLINKVYQIPASRYFYSMDTSGTIGSVKSEPYSGTRLPASFSSREKALEYVMFNEYRDLYAVTLTAELADELNAGIFAAQKALGENTVASAGQVWIRYKAPTWDVSRAHDKNDWVFYYYGDSENLRPSKFSKLLTDAIKSISERITDQGKTVALTDFSLSGDGTGNSLVDKLGAPYLDPSQIFVGSKSLTEQTPNSKFITDITYTGDAAIYSSNVLLNGTDSYVLIGNSLIPAGISLHYKRIDENGTESGVWTELKYVEGQRFRDVLEGSGRYMIRELGEGGVSEYKVYIDSDAPRVQISWQDKDGNTQTQTLNKASEKEFRAKSLKIGIDAIEYGREYDKYSYVAFYNASKELYAVYWLTDLQRSPVYIPDGNYYMVVADRSGNSYTMSVYINSSNLNCDIKEIENVKIKFTCDRKASQIQEFYVKRNGVLLEGKYSSEMEFTDSGIYEFYVRDIYGNVYGPVECVFTRVYPTVTWKYRDTETGFYVTYTEESKTKQFSLEKISDGSYVISTATDLKFQLADGYGYTFVGVDPGHSENPADKTVTIKNTQQFQLKVYYKKYPDVYTIYHCTVDTAAPLIDVSVQGSTLIPDEIDELREAIKSGTAVLSGNKLIPSKISYSAVETDTRYIANNDTVLSDFIRVEIRDETGLALAQVYLNGKLIKEQSGTNASDDIILDKLGEYRIVAEDALGNQSEFHFTNGTPDSFGYIVDGLPMMVGLHDSDKFDEYGNYADTTFGNESVIFVIGEPMKIFYMITDADGAKHFVAFDVRDKMVREIYYCTDSENNLVLEASDTVLFDGNHGETTENREHIIYEIKEIGLKIYARVNAMEEVVLSIFTSDVPSVTVDARLNTDDEKFYYYTKTELSTQSPSLTIRTDKNEKPKEFVEPENMIMLNKAFSISTDHFEVDKIAFVEVYYSDKNDFAGMEYLTKDEIYSEGAYYDKEGFYFVRLVNQYGNEGAFVIHLSNRFDVTAYSEFADGTKNHYSADYSGTLYSNSKVIFELYSDHATVKVQKDGVEYRPVITVNNGITYVILSESGRYTVRMSDEHQNTVERSAEIDSSSVTFNESLLTGYNENALKKNDGYTNQKLSVNKAVFDQEKICYMSVQYGDSLTVIYDSISELGAPLDESKLFELIGNQGDGEYVLQIRNRYGSVLTKVLHYRGTPTLTLERVIRSSIEPEAYDISKALSIGFWSNSELIFKTDAEIYEFTVNGDKTECPKTLAFATAEQQGRSEYEITYIDEYGFSYSFKAYLVRQTLEIQLDLSNEGINIDGVTTTLEDIAVKFSENAYCTYTLNNSEEKVYNPGEKLSLDGIYRFVAVDYAGNTAAMTVKKDTTVEFEFVEVNTSTALQSGGVVNDSKVEFKTVNGDSAFIEKAFKNGVLQSDFSTTKLSEDGKWEFIVSDKLGNKSYFCFYIINKHKSSFAYTTPYEYQVTELWYDSGDGEKISYLKFVNHSETSSSFEFIENGRYSVVMTSTVTGSVSKFEFTINTNAPAVSLVGCNPGDTTLNDVTVTGCVVGDIVKVYRATNTGEELVSMVEVTSLSTKIPTVNEGGKYRIVVESEAGVETELSFVRKHVMNTEGNIFIMIVIAVAVIGLFVGLVYRNKSKTDK